MLSIDHGCETVDGVELGGAGRDGGTAAPIHPAESTNRPGGNRHGGEDTIDFGWQVQWPKEVWKRLSRDFKCAQEAARGDEEAKTILEVGARRFVVRPAGRAAGKTFYAFIAESEGMQLAFMDRDQPWGKTPNVRVHLGAIPLMVLGIDEAYQRMRSTIEAAGGRIVAETLSRVDPAIDLIGVEASEFVKAILEQRCIRRARNVQYFQEGLKWTGVAVGMGGVVSLRIYDKVAECADTAKWTYMIACRYGGEAPATATRVEFQIRRRALKEFGVDSVQQWVEKRAEIIRYLTEEWFRLVDSAVDRRNTERYTPSTFWQRISKEFISWCGVASTIAKRIAKSCFEYKQVRRQVLGCLGSLAAKWGQPINDLEDFVAVLWDCVRDEREAGAEELLVRRAKTKSKTFEVVACFG